MRPRHLNRGDGLGLCGSHGAVTFDREVVSCLHCLDRLPSVKMPRPVYPAAEFCSTCGLSTTHWPGCPGAPMVVREAEPVVVTPRPSREASRHEVRPVLLRDEIPKAKAPVVPAKAPAKRKGRPPKAAVVVDPAEECDLVERAAAAWNGCGLRVPPAQRMTVVRKATGVGAGRAVELVMAARDAGLVPSLPGSPVA